MAPPLLSGYALLFALGFPTILAQFAGGFAPSNSPYGGFGGGACTSTKTPVVFLHGNAGKASDWNAPSTVDGLSPIDHFHSAGYTACDLYGLTWLSTTEQANQADNFHKEAKAQMVTDFISSVKSYTGKSTVTVIGHSMGVTVGLHSFAYNNNWASIKSFIGISGGMLGLSTCIATGPSNPLFPTCGSENVFDSNVFGFYPGDGGILPNSHMSQATGFVNYPGQHSAIKFYTIRAGASDEFVCPTQVGCTSSLFKNSGNVPSQVDVGEGDPTVNSSNTDDSSGVGHFRSKTNTGAIQVNMAVGGCSGLSCCSGYDGNVCM